MVDSNHDGPNPLSGDVGQSSVELFKKNLLEQGPLHGVEVAGKELDRSLISKLMKDHLCRGDTNLRARIEAGLTERVLSDDRVRSILHEGVLVDVLGKYSSSSKKKILDIRQVLSSADQVALCELYPAYNFSFRDPVDNKGHTWARACRKAERQTLFDMLGFTSDSKPPPGYAVYLKDVGGNKITHLNARYSNTHVCSPVMDHNDSVRHSNYIVALSEFPRKTVDLTPSVLALYNEHCAGDLRRGCNVVSQSCHVRAHRVMFLHSIYNISVPELGAIMFNSGAAVGAGCFIFNQSVLYLDSGYLSGIRCHFRRITRDNRVLIRFWFEDDTQEGYEHDYVNYVSLLTSFRIRHDSGDGSSKFYNVELPFVVNDVQYFKLTESIHDHIPASRPFRVLSDSTIPSHVIIYYWHWDSIPSLQSFSNDARSHMRPVRVCVTRVFFERLYSYALTLADGKFTVKNLIIAATTFNTREVASGTSVVVPEKHPVDVVHKLAHAVFLLVYVANYECSKTLSVLVEQENRVRAESTNAFVFRLFRGIKRSVSDRISSAFFRLPEDLRKAVEIDVASQDSLRLECPTTNIIKTMYKNLMSITTPKRDHSVDVASDMVKFLTIDEELDAVRKSRGFSHIQPSSHTLYDLLDPAVVVNALLSGSMNADLPEPHLSESVMHSHVCGAILDPVPNYSQGHCILQSVLDGSIAHGCVSSLRARLLSSSHLLTFSDRVAIDASLRRSEDVVASLSIEVLMLVAMEYSVRVCVHYDTSSVCKSYGVGPTHHFLITSRDAAPAHCQYLKLSEKLQPVASHVLTACRHTDGYDPNSSDGTSSLITLKHLSIPAVYMRDAQRLIAKFGKLPRISDRSRLRHERINRAVRMANVLDSVHRNQHSLAFLNSAGYTDFTGVQLAEFIEREFDSARPITGSVVLLSATPGAIECLATRITGQVYYLADNSNAVVDIVGPYASKCVPLSPEFPHLPPSHYDNIAGYREVVLSANPEGVSLVIGPLVVPMSIENPMVPDEFYVKSSVYFSFLFAQSVLSKNGVFLSRVTHLSSSYVRYVCSFSLSCFSSTEFLNLQSDYFHLPFPLMILRGYDGSWFNRYVTSATVFGYPESLAVHYAGKAYISKEMDDELTELQLQLEYNQHSKFSTLIHLMSDVGIVERSVTALSPHLQRVYSKRLMCGVSLSFRGAKPSSSIAGRLAGFLTPFSKRTGRQAREDFVTAYKENPTLSPYPDWSCSSHLIDVSSTGSVVPTLKVSLMDILFPKCPVSEFMKRAIPDTEVLDDVGFIPMLPTLPIPSTSMSAESVPPLPSFGDVSPEPSDVNDDPGEQGIHGQPAHSEGDSVTSDESRSDDSSHPGSQDSPYDSGTMLSSGSGSCLGGSSTLTGSDVSVPSSETVRLWSDLYDMVSGLDMNDIPLNNGTASVSNTVIHATIPLTGSSSNALTSSDEYVECCTVSSSCDSNSNDTSSQVCYDSFPDRLSDCCDDSPPPVIPDCASSSISSASSRIPGILNIVRPSALKIMRENARNTEVREAMIEYLSLLDHTVRTQIKNFSRLENMYRSPSVPLNGFKDTRENYAAIKLVSGVLYFHIRPTASRDLKSYRYFYSRGSLTPVADLLESDGDVLVNDYCIDSNDVMTLESLHRLDVNKFVLPSDLKFIQAAPGCGKTHYINTHHCPPVSSSPSTVLLSTREGRLDFDRKSREMHNGGAYYSYESRGGDRVGVPSSFYRTLSSCLVNASSVKTTSTLFLDEALMAHPGALFFAIMIVRPTSVWFLGDRLQIPYVNRCPDFKAVHLSLDKYVNVHDVLYVSYRCPVDVAFRLSNTYNMHNNAMGFDLGMMSTRNLTNTCFKKKISSECDVPVDSKATYLTFTQSDKKLIMDKLKVPVSTVHEFQGKENDIVIVVRLNRNPMEDIFLKSSYALVALSRHKVKLTYYTTYLNDALGNLIKTSLDKPLPIASEYVMMKYLKTDVGSVVNPSSTCFYVERCSSNYQSFPTTTAYFSTSSYPKLHFVPRVGHYSHTPSTKPNQMNSDCVIKRTPGRGTEIFLVSSGKSSKFPSLSHLRKTLPSLRSLLNKHDIQKISINDDVFKGDIDPTSLSQMLYQRTGKVVRVLRHTSGHRNEIDPKIFDALNVNGESSLPTPQFVDMFPDSRDLEPGLSALETSSVVVGQCDVESMRILIDSVYGPVAYVNQKHDAWMVHFDSDPELMIKRFKYSPIKSLYVDPSFDNMSPVLATPVPHPRMESAREVLLALYKRNCNIPELSDAIPIDDVSSDMLDAFLRECCSPAALSSAVTDPITVSPMSMQEWLDKQPVGICEKIVGELSLHESPLSDYSFSIKKTPKPNLTVEAASSYAALQTIVFHEKYVNAVFCPIFTEIKRRVMAVLRNNVRIFTDMSATDFANVLTDRVGDGPMALFSGDDSLLIDGSGRALEIDISKYDKSQGHLALLLECKFMRFFGLPEYYINLWYNCHYRSRLRSRSAGMTADVMFQRKSGDASTFLGNTLFLMSVISYVVPLSALSTINVRDYQDAYLFGSLFNLEVKFFLYDYMYFCSKFLLRVDCRWYFVPDPVKLVCKLGRHDLVNPTHVECYRVSVADTVLDYSNYAVCGALASAISERYSILYDMTHFLNSLSTVSDEAFFNTLYEILPGSNIDHSRLVNAPRD